VRETLTEVIEPIVFAEALELLREHREAGRRVFLVSSSPEEIVRPLAEHLGVQDVIATRVKVIDGRYTGELEFYCYGPQKAEALRGVAEREGVDLGASYAYSDSITDAPLLEAVGHPVAVNPDRDLRRLAAQRGWQVRDFRRPVPMRRFVRVPRSRARIAAVAGVAAIAAVLAWVYLRPRHRRSSA
ncbi:MAG TPA: HAD family hydrolase, partial [Actinomycetota bacterium]|nr:HAD family hydrolase [Actinomycetota bacterium]